MTMPVSGPIESIREQLRRQAHLITRSQALAGGMTDAAIKNKIRPNGPWRAVLPGSYLAANGSLGFAQREMAAVLYAGRESVITGRAALRLQNFPVPAEDLMIDVLAPASTQRQSLGFVRVHRTRRLQLGPVRPGRDRGGRVVGGRG